MSKFTTDCTKCSRLAAFLNEVKQEQPDYFCKPVPSFGDPKARLLIVGLAPGMHGANATGRPFTGDHAGILLYKTLHDCGFATQPEGVTADDGLELINCRITNAVRCLPPQNKPVGEEINNCNAYLADELALLAPRSVIFALGGIAHRAVVRALQQRQADYKFGHAAEFKMPGDLILLDSYHCSRYNTNTRRLTAEMFNDVFRRARSLVDNAENNSVSEVA